MEVACIGDSLTEGLGVDKENSWPMTLAKSGKMKVINRGISGDTTTGMTSRFYHDVIGYQPTHSIIMGGHNDLWWDAPLNSILSNIYSMAKQSVHHKITPIIGIPTPIYIEGINHETVWKPRAGYQMLQNKLYEFSSSLKVMVENNRWNFIDFYSLYINQNQYVNSHYFVNTDGIHPNEKGHQAMANLVLNLLEI
ncbi:SGNH/GDSL hydrolase family protein [Priestia megaterium]|jgi:lysophospholipase L1-like esterase|uniref:SGNH/GDSL hydrolase family protein n=1 Tax=Priestia megaterium TaxID=1404 RepID=UPI000BF584A1|nr:SGNH/GDSL hydrolase family protein [Priestia megaterium]PFJ49539.1 lysophospholipase [Priestia megaterium]PFK69169.1 lysophospholipase [Priestia megaterium]